MMATQPTHAKATGLEIGEQFIRRDIARILILLSVVALILIVMVVMNGRSNLLFDAGHKLAQFFKLQ
jgi:hypothetical protein